MALGAAAAFAVAALAALPALAQSLTSAAYRRGGRAAAADLRAGERKAALAKRLNPLSVDPLFAQASIAERGNQPRKAARLLVDAVDLQPDNPDTWNRLLRFQALLDDTGGAASTLRPLFGLDPVLVFQVSGGSITSAYDPGRSASATGTPLPEKLRRAPGRARARSGDPAVRRRPARARAAGAGAHAGPAPTPTPTPAPAPKAAAQGAPASPRATRSASRAERPVASRRMAWLLTGGAGYIGSHIALAFGEAGTDVVVLDDLSTGYRSYVPDDVDFVDGSVDDPDAVAARLRPARHRRRGAPGRPEVRGRLGRAAAGVLPRERDRDPGAAGGRGRARHRQLPVLQQRLLVRHA